MIPVGWKKVSLLDVVSLPSGQVDPKKAPYCDYVLIAPDHIESGTGRIIGRKKAREQGAISGKYVADKGDIIYSKIRPYLKKVALIDERVLCSADMYPMRCNGELIPNYLLNVLLSKEFTDFAIGQSGRTGIPKINREELKEYQIRLPPLPEQQKIAEILSCWDRGIELINGIINRRSIEVSHFISGLLRSKSIAFKSKQLCEVGDIVSGGTPDTRNPTLWGGGIQWVTPTDITAMKSKYLSSTSRTISEEGLKQSSATLMPVNSIVVCTRATVGDLAITQVPMTTNQGFKSIVPGVEFDALYLYYAVREKKQEMVRLSAGSTFLEISKKDFSRIEIPIPDFKIQKLIGIACDAMDREVETLSKISAALKIQKQALIQQLLTGKIRVKV